MTIKDYQKRAAMKYKQTRASNMCVHKSFKAMIVNMFPLGEYVAGTKIIADTYPKLAEFYKNYKKETK